MKHGPSVNWDCKQCHAPNPPNTSRCNSCGYDATRANVGKLVPPIRVAGMTRTELQAWLGTHPAAPVNVDPSIQAALTTALQAAVSSVQKG